MYSALVAATLKAIERGKGTKGLSLRSIARDAGCSHANVYHYSRGLDGLVWDAYCISLSDFAKRCEASIDSALRGENVGAAFARAAIAYAHEHEGLYRLLWLDSLPEPIPESALQSVIEHSGSYANRIKAALGGSNSDADQAAGFLMAYVMGEIAMILAGRIMEGPEEAAARAIKGAGALWEMISERFAAGIGIDRAETP